MNKEYFDSVLPPSGTGRPRIVLNDKGKKLIEMLSKYMVTEEELAAELDVTVETLHSKWNEDAFLECKKKGQMKGKASLRRNQFKLAEKYPAMAMYLGKVYLGQREYQDLDSGEKDIKGYDTLFSQPVKVRTFNDLEDDAT